MAANYAAAAIRKKGPLDEDRVQIRLRICRGDGETSKCEMYRDEDQRCAECGCWLDIIPHRDPVFGKAGKSRWIGLDCGLNKWPELK
jgi:hypothetical protein